MPKFVLVANLSPKIARFLAARYGLDVVSLLTLGMGDIPDRQVTRFARSSGRVIITLDEDFAPPSDTMSPGSVGVIYLDLPNNHRYIPSIQAALGAFFEHHAAEITLESVIVVLYEDRFVVHQRHGEMSEIRPLIP